MVVAVNPPVVEQLAPAPNRGMSSDEYPVVADKWAAGIGPWTLQINNLSTWQAAAMAATLDYKTTAGASATQAALAASTASLAKEAAQKAVTDTGTAGARQVQLATDQVALALAAKSDTQAIATAVGVSAGVPPARDQFTTLSINSAGNVVWEWGLPNRAVGKTGQSVMLGADKVPYWGYAGQQIGDILVTARNPGALYLPANGSIRSQASYPTLFAALGLIGGVIGTAWADYDLGGSNVGFAASLSGTIIVSQSPTQVRRSADRGKTWANIATPNLGFSPNDIKTDGNGIWIILSSSSGPTYQCLRSTDDGVTWELVNLPATSSQAGGGWWKLLYCGNNVWIASSNYSLTLLRSSNGGASWVPITHGYPVGNITASASNGAGIVLISAYDGSNNTVRKSTDSGLTFSGFLTLTAQTNCISTDGQGAWIIGLGGSNALRSFDDAASSSSFAAFTITGGVGSNLDMIFVSGLVLYMFSGSGAKVIIQAANGSFAPQTSAVNVSGRFGNVGNGTIFGSSATANRLSRSVQQFGYDTSTQFALPNPQAVNGVTAYIKALEAA